MEVIYTPSPREGPPMPRAPQPRDKRHLASLPLPPRGHGGWEESIPPSFLPVTKFKSII